MPQSGEREVGKKGAAPKPANAVEERLVKQWKVLVPAVTWVMATIGSFWLPVPPGLVTEESKVMVSFARYLATISTGLMILPMLAWSNAREKAWLWGKIGAAAALLSIAAFISYLYLQESWTVRHHETVLYVGTEIKGEVAEFVRVYQPGKEELLESAGWVPARVWTERSIERCRLILTVIYVLGIPLFVVALVSVAQVIYCSSRKE